MSSPDERPDSVLDELLAGAISPVADAQEEARVRRIAMEATHAFRLMAGVRRGVAVFGSAREGAATQWGSLARETAGALVDSGFTVITGGGPGLMAAANEGAFKAGGTSVGLTIHLPDDEPPNEFLTLEVPFHYFFLRKLSFVKYSCAFVLLPGGYGTLDELFEVLNLRRTHRLDPFPAILMGSQYWAGLLNWLGSEGTRGGTLSEEDLDSLTITDDPAEVVREVTECHATLCRRLGVEPWVT